MNAVKQLQPFELLRSIEERSRQQAFGIPQQIEVRRPWSGIGFRVGDTYLVSPLGEVEEILVYPDLTRVPSAQIWVKGIANVRGTLLPIMDLRGFIEGQATRLQRRTRVLVIRHKNLAAGLVVDEALGLRHFFEEEHTDSLPQVSAELAGYIGGAYRQGERLWGVFDMHQLAEDPRFLQVAGRA